MPHPAIDSSSAPQRHPRQLALLTVAVVLAHWAVLRSAPLALATHDHREAANAWSFSTRTVAQPKAAPSAAPVTVNPTRTTPARPQTGKRPTPSTNLFPSSHLEQNEVTAHANTANDAPLFIADSAETNSNAATPPAPLAGVAPSESESEPQPLPAKAVRAYVFPPPARLRYTITGEVKGFPYHVNGELAWTQDGKSYDARMEISHFLLGSRVQTSTGQLTAQGLEPTRFGDKVKSEVAAHFERDKGKVTFSANTPDAPLLAGAQDQLSIFLQMAAMLGGDPNGFPQGSTLAFQAVGPRTADAWVFTVGALETLTLPGGDLAAVHLWRDPSGEYDPKADIWLAPALGFLPVRIRLTQRNGDFVDQQWKSTQQQ